MKKRLSDYEEWIAEKAVDASFVIGTISRKPKKIQNLFKFQFQLGLKTFEEKSMQEFLKFLFN